MMDIVESYSAGENFSAGTEFSIFPSENTHFIFSGHNNLVATVKQMKKQVMVVLIIIIILINNECHVHYNS